MVRLPDIHLLIIGIVQRDANQYTTVHFCCNSSHVLSIKLILVGSFKSSKVVANVVPLLCGIAPAVQAIPPIATHFFIAWSVCLSHLRTLLKPFDGFRCHLAGTPMGSSVHCMGSIVSDGGPCLTNSPCMYVIKTFAGIFSETLGQTPNQNMQLQTAARSPVLCCHLANTNEQFRFLLNYFCYCC